MGRSLGKEPGRSLLGSCWHKPEAWPDSRPAGFDEQVGVASSPRLGAYSPHTHSSAPDAHTNIHSSRCTRCHRSPRSYFPESEQTSPPQTYPTTHSHPSSYRSVSCTSPPQSRSCHTAHSGIYKPAFLPRGSDTFLPERPLECSRGRRTSSSRVRASSNIPPV